MVNDVVVLGGGLAGLSFAYHFGSFVPVYEKEAEPGGLVRTVSNGPYRFDLAPHLLHIRSAEVEDLVFKRLGLNVRKHNRRAKIYVDNVVIPYPFELNLKKVSKSTREDCLDGLAAIEATDRDAENELRSGSYGDYVMKAFGAGIANHYLLPYNRKIWDTDPFDMTCDWMRFLPTAEVEQIRKNAVEENRNSFGYNTVFYYPTEQGIQELPEAFARNVPGLVCGEKATRIDTESRVVSFASGREEKYGQLVSTLPLTDLASLTGVEELDELASGLSFTSVYVVNVVIKGKVPQDTHWMYFPDPDLSFYRISFPKAYFDLAAPNDEHIVAVEVGSRQTDLDIPTIERRVVGELGRLDIFEINEVVKIHTEHLRNAYVIYDSERAQRVRKIQDLLRRRNILSIGRYGNWEYAAMEDAIIQGRDAALALKSA